MLVMVKCFCCITLLTVRRRSTSLFLQYIYCFIIWILSKVCLCYLSLKSMPLDWYFVTWYSDICAFLSSIYCTFWSHNFKIILGMSAATVCDVVLTPFQKPHELSAGSGITACYFIPALTLTPVTQMLLWGSSKGLPHSHSHLCGWHLCPQRFSIYLPQNCRSLALS